MSSQVRVLSSAEFQNGRQGLGALPAQPSHPGHPRVLSPLSKALSPAPLDSQGKLLVCPKKATFFTVSFISNS